MRGTRLALALATGALLAPASASATTFMGTCDLAAPAGLSASGYGFDGHGTCNGVLNGAEAGYEVVWSSAGSGAFACGTGLFTGGASRLDFYAIALDAPGQPRLYVDTLELVDGLGGASPSGHVRRSLRGAAAGSATEEGRIAGGCEGGRYAAGLRTVGQVSD